MKNWHGYLWKSQPEKPLALHASWNGSGHQLGTVCQPNCCMHFFQFLVSTATRRICGLLNSWETNYCTDWLWWLFLWSQRSSSVHNDGKSWHFQPAALVLLLERTRKNKLDCNAHVNTTQMDHTSCMGRLIGSLKISFIHWFTCKKLTLWQWGQGYKKYEANKLMLLLKLLK